MYNNNIKDLNLSELNSEETKTIEGGNSDPGVWDDPNTDNDGCIPDPVSDWLDDITNAPSL